MNRPLLDLRHLEMIAALAETPRVTDAAEALGITPSALSHRLREVERRLDVPLFTRVRRRLRPTPAATHLARIATRTLAELARAEADVRRMALGAKRVVRLAVEDYSAYHWLPAFLRHLRDGGEDIGIEIVAAASREPLACLREGTIDLGIVTAGPDAPGFDFTRLFADELVFVMAPAHHLAKRAFVEGPDIVGEDFVTYSRVPAPDREYARLFRPSGAYPNWTETVEVPEAIVELVAAGLGVSFLSAWAVRPAIDSGRIVAARASREGIAIEWSAATRAGGGAEDERHRSVARRLARWCASHPQLGGGTTR